MYKEPVSLVKDYLKKMARGENMIGEKVLVVEDDSDIREILGLCLLKEGYDVYTAIDGWQGLQLARALRPDLIILDVQLPKLDGFALCKELRQESTTPVIFLSCKDADQDKIRGLTIGGDDYLTKPFSMGELVARVKVQLRRRQTSETAPTSGELLIYPGLVIDTRAHTVTLNGEPVELTLKEFEILTLLARNPNAVFSVEHIFSSVWGVNSMGDNRTTMVHISNLRKKVEPDPANPKYIHTIKGVGYRFSPVAR